MKIGDIVKIIVYSGFEQLGLIVEQRVYFNDQVSFTILWDDGSITDGWLESNMFMKVIS
jgi:hypothetical protein